MPSAKQYVTTVERILSQEPRPRAIANLTADLARAYGDTGLREPDLDALLASYPETFTRASGGWWLTNREATQGGLSGDDLHGLITFRLEQSTVPIGVASIIRVVTRAAPLTDRASVLNALEHPYIQRVAPGKYVLHPDERERRKRARAEERQPQEPENALLAHAHGELVKRGTPRTPRALAARSGGTVKQLQEALESDARFEFDEATSRWALREWRGKLRALFVPASQEAVTRAIAVHAHLHEHGATSLDTLCTLTSASRAEILESLRTQPRVFCITERRRVGVPSAASVICSLAPAAHDVTPLLPRSARTLTRKRRASAQASGGSRNAREVLARFLDGSGADD